MSRIPTCPACGADAGHGRPFCSACGSPLSATGEHPPAASPPQPPTPVDDPPVPGAPPAISAPARRRRWWLIGAAALFVVAAVVVVIVLVGGGSGGGVDWAGAEWETGFETGTISGRAGDLFVAHPSGRIAYHGDDEICAADLTGTEPTLCHPLDWNPSRFDATWSPDGRYLAFTEDFLRLRLEPDVWLWDIEQNSLVNLTDDGIEGGFGPEPGATLDIFPVFVSDREIAFLRLSRSDSGATDTALWTIDPTGGDPVEVIAELVPLDHFIGASAELPVAHPVGRDGRWYLAVADPEKPELEILSVVVSSGTAERTPVTGDITLDEGLLVQADPTGQMVAVSRACLVYGAKPGSCIRYVIDPPTAVATATPSLPDDRFDPDSEGPFPTAFVLALSPDRNAAAGCFTARQEDTHTNLIAITALEQPEWKVIGEFPINDAGPCSGPPAWTDAGIAVPLLDDERYGMLRPEE